MFWATFWILSGESGPMNISVSRKISASEKRRNKQWSSRAGSNSIILGPVTLNSSEISIRETKKVLIFEDDIDFGSKPVNFFLSTSGLNTNLNRAIMAWIIDIGPFGFGSKWNDGGNILYAFKFVSAGRNIQSINSVKRREYGLLWALLILEILFNKHLIEWGIKDKFSINPEIIKGINWSTLDKIPTKFFLIAYCNKVSSRMRWRRISPIDDCM